MDTKEQALTFQWHRVNEIAPLLEIPRNLSTKLK